MDLDELIPDFCHRLDSAQIEYLIGGSFASSVWGEPRQTNDVDVEVWLTPENEGRFVQSFADPYYVSKEEVREALTSSDIYRSVQVLHMDAVFKFDCFLQGHSPIDREAYERALFVEIFPGQHLRLACPEHILVQKLRWYELGNRVNERQWRDLKFVAKVRDDLDWVLVDRWGGMLGLESALHELKDELQLDAEN